MLNTRQLTAIFLHAVQLKWPHTQSTNYKNARPFSYAMICVVFFYIFFLSLSLAQNCLSHPHPHRFVCQEWKTQNKNHLKWTYGWSIVCKQTDKILWNNIAVWKTCYLIMMWFYYISVRLDGWLWSGKHDEL